MKYKNEVLTLQGLLDTGADTSIISSDSYPVSWPLFPAMATVTGVGGMSLAKRTPVVTLTLDKQQLTVIFSVVQLPAGVQCLLGRDVLSQMGMILTNDDQHLS